MRGAMRDVHRRMAAYRSRPPYQRNDYLAWIGRAKLDETKHRRLLQMINELEAGDRYMRMKWRPGPARVRTTGTRRR